MAFHRTYVVRVNADGRGGGVVFSENDSVVFPMTDPSSPLLDALDLGLDAIRKKTGRSIVTVFLLNESDQRDRWYGVVTSPTL